MSSEPTGQEPEYIVTVEQMEIIENKSTNGYGDCMIPQEILDAIRSRPYSPAPEQSPNATKGTLQTIEKAMDEFLTDDLDPEYIIRERLHIELSEAMGSMNEHEIWQSERENALKELKKDLQTRFISSNNQWSKGRNSGLIECCNIIDESLRAGKEE
jgi:hypothetical protein